MIFARVPVNLPAPVFHLTEKENETAFKMAVNQKITSIYLNDTGPRYNYFKTKYEVILWRTNGIAGY